MVVYRPLYDVQPDSWVYGYDFAARPLSMCFNIVEWNEEKIQRFTQI